MVRVKNRSLSDIHKGLFDSSRTIRVSKNQEMVSSIYALRFILSVLNPFCLKIKGFPWKDYSSFLKIKYSMFARVSSCYHVTISPFILLSAKPELTKTPRLKTYCFRKIVYKNTITMSTRIPIFVVHKICIIIIATSICSLTYIFLCLMFFSA